MSIMRTERLIARDGSVIEQRDFDGYGRLVRKTKPAAKAAKATQKSKQNLQKEKQMSKKLVANIPPKVEPLGIPGVMGYGELKFHQGIGHITLSQMLQQQLNRLERGDDLLSLREIYDTHCIYFSSNDDKLYKRNYSVTDGTVELADDVQEVREERSFEPTNQQISKDVEPLGVPGFTFNKREGNAVVKPMHANGFNYPAK